MLSEGMRVQLGFYLGRTAGRKLLQRYVVSVGGVNTNGISGPIYTESLQMIRKAKLRYLVSV